MKCGGDIRRILLQVINSSTKNTVISVNSKLCWWILCWIKHTDLGTADSFFHLKSYFIFRILLTLSLVILISKCSVLSRNRLCDDHERMMTAGKAVGCWEGPVHREYRPGKQSRALTRVPFTMSTDWFMEGHLWSQLTGGSLSKHGW